jgi:hypothetical protein
VRQESRRRRAGFPSSCRERGLLARRAHTRCCRFRQGADILNEPSDEGRSRRETAPGLGPFATLFHRTAAGGRYPRSRRSQPSGCSFRGVPSRLDFVRFRLGDDEVEVAFPVALELADRASSAPDEAARTAAARIRAAGASRSIKLSPVGQAALARVIDAWEMDLETCAASAGSWASRLCLTSATGEGTMSACRQRTSSASRPAPSSASLSPCCCSASPRLQCSGRTWPTASGG